MSRYLKWNQIDRPSRISSILGLCGGITVLATLVSTFVNPPTGSDPGLLFFLLFPFIIFALPLAPVLGVVAIYAVIVGYILFLFVGPVLVLTGRFSEHTRGIVSFLIFLGSFPWVVGLLFILPAYLRLP